MGKRLPQLYYVKMKIFYDFGFFFCNRSRHGSVITRLRFFVYLCVSMYHGFFFKKSLKGVCTCHNCLNYCKV